MDFGKTKSIQSTIKENWYVCDPNKAVWIVARGTQWLLEKICSHITHTGIFFKMSFRILSTAKMQIVQNTRDFERFFFSQHMKPYQSFMSNWYSLAGVYKTTFNRRSRGNWTKMHARHRKTGSENSQKLSQWDNSMRRLGVISLVVSYTPVISKVIISSISRTKFVIQIIILCRN